MTKFFRRYGLTIVTALFIMYVCLMPQENVPDIDFDWDSPSVVKYIFDFVSDYSDKFAHVFFYFVLAIVAAIDFYRQRVDFGTKKMLFLSLFCPSLYGGLIEIMQMTLTTSRSGDWMDFVADIIGAVIGYLIACKVVPGRIDREKVLNVC